ncbi:hypothetical protein OQA88_4380 [Cercophora sp. LCS_1]
MARPPRQQPGNAEASSSGTRPLEQVDSKYGLDGPITKIVDDRGESDYRRDFSPTANMQPSPPVSLIQLARDLSAAKVASFHEQFAYIPRDNLESIMSYSQVLAIVMESKEFQCGNQDSKAFAHRICFGKGSKAPCRKLLAALVAARLEQLLKAALDAKMDDNCLPLKYAPGNQAMSIACRILGHQHREFQSQLHPVDLDSLIRWTRALTAPYIKQSPTQHFHYVLEHGDHLPFEIGGQVMQNMEASETAVVSKEAHFDPDVCIAHGGFGKVFMVRIHPSHWNFGGNDTGHRRPNKWFALKQLNDNDPKKFETELKSLLYCLHHEFIDETLLREGQRHMVHVRASIEVRNSTNNNTDYYFLFDWQNGNLTQFWQNEEGLRKHSDHLLWMSQQLFGLAAALQCVHNDRSAYQTPHHKLNEVTVYGRHGDLGPSNILYSRSENGELELKLTDFGLAQLHSRFSRTFGNSTFTPKTETYGAPDFDIQDGYISRATDIFSFGCVVLECITWYLLGYKGVQDFSNARFGQSHRSGLTDNYYTIIAVPPNGQTAVLKEQVIAHIFNLVQHQRCSWYLRQMLQLVQEKMLNPDPEKRIQSNQLTRALDAYRKTCEADSSFYREPWRSAYTARTAAALPDEIALSSTYIPANNTSYAVFYGCNKRQTRDILTSLRSAPKSVDHPLLCAGIFTELERRRLVDLAEDLVDKFTVNSDILENQSWNLNTLKMQESLAICVRSRALMDQIRFIKRQLTRILDEFKQLETEGWLSAPAAEMGMLVKQKVVDTMDEFEDKIDECNMMAENLSLAMQTFIPVSAFLVPCETAKGKKEVARVTSRINERRSLRSRRPRRKYRPSLTAGGSGSHLKDASGKIQYKILDERDITGFQQEIIGQTAALQMLLELLTIHALERNHEELKAKVDDLTDETRPARRDILATNLSLSDGITEFGRRILQRLAFIAQMTTDIKRTCVRILAAVLTLAFEMSTIRFFLMTMGNPSAGEYFTLEDAAGRMMLIHFNTITTRQGFAFVLSENFKGLRGARRARD